MKRLHWSVQVGAENRQSSIYCSDFTIPNKDLWVSVSMMPPNPEYAFQIRLDGMDLRQLNVKTLRESIGIVSQEPILFDGTLEENVKFY